MVEEVTEVQLMYFVPISELRKVEGIIDVEKLRERAVLVFKDWAKCHECDEYDRLEVFAVYENTDEGETKLCIYIVWYHTSSVYAVEYPLNTDPLEAVKDVLDKFYDSARTVDLVMS